ncbi:GNAT family N-acetyltransferase [Pseudactinotalea terrae]|uniref:GNAT family N-acetyltransferase n=1 Tax=Pseudactinotalea terrae TaxID=1743262 RepID=UPI001391D2B0|nr:GNAT family N-acetyltransferase [Pseudactinotalea terrae]
MHLFSPASRHDAIDLIQSFSPSFDTPGQRLLFAQPSLDRLFERGQRAPERVWALRSADPRTTGVVAGRLLGDFALVDLLALPEDDDAATLLVDAATSWARTAASAEVSFETPVTDEPLSDPAVARLVELFGRAGWRVLVTRRHYHLPATAVAEVSAAVPLSVDLEPASAADRDRLVSLLGRVLPGSLDVHDRELVTARGVAAAAAEQADDLLAADPPECLRFATTAGNDLGFVSWRRMPDGRAYVLAVGVAVEHRGRGLGAELVAAATRDLVAAGAHTLVADTDDANVGMVRGFARAGWAATAARIDLAPV